MSQTEHITKDIVKEIVDEISEENLMEESLASDMVGNEYKDDNIEFEIRTDPTLEEIKEKTENFTLLEIEPGHLYRKYKDDAIDKSSLNSKVVCRARYLLREVEEELLFCKSQQEAHKIIKKVLDEAYKEYPLWGNYHDFKYTIEKVSDLFGGDIRNYIIKMNTNSLNIVWLRVATRK